jgi:hypothetical protein
MKIHFSTFGSSFDFFSSGTCMYAMELNIMRCETSGFLLVNFFQVSCDELPLWVFDS